MSALKNVLLVTNSTTDDEIITIQNSFLEAEQTKNILIHLSLVHVIPTLPACYFSIPSMVTLANRYHDEAKKTLTLVGDSLGVHRKNQWLVAGRIKNEVFRLGIKLNTHFILASSTCIKDLQKTLYKNSRHFVPVQNISQISAPLI